MIKLLRFPKIQLSLLLLLIFISALFTQFAVSILTLLILSLISTIGSDLLFTYIKQRKLFIPYAAVVSGLILTLTIAPITPWYGVILIGVIAMAGKSFIKIKNRHIFNPAAFGLVVGGIILHTTVSWWGSSFQNITNWNIEPIILFIILLLPLLVSGIRMKRFYSIISFYIMYIALSLLLLHVNSLQSFLSLILGPSLIFFTIVMLPEPITSPITRKNQIIYGVLIAILVQILLLPMVSGFLAPIGLLPDPFLIALLIANLIFLKIK